MGRCRCWILDTGALGIPRARRPLTEDDDTPGTAAVDPVRVNAIAPGPTETPMLDRSGLTPELVAAIKEAEARRIPLGRRGEPEEVARWIVLLASPESEWVTGQVVGVDGGWGASEPGRGPDRSRGARSAAMVDPA